VPELWIHRYPDAVETANVCSFFSTWPNQTELTLKGLHFIQEDRPTEIGEAVANFLRGLREQ
jgi:haloalkane dehalogenase